MFSVQSPGPLRRCREGEAVEKGRELLHDNKRQAVGRGRVPRKVGARTRARQREAESSKKEIEEKERLDAEEADYRRVCNEGKELFYKKNFQEAAAHYTEAIKRNPNDPTVYSNRAKCHIYLGALPEGFEDAEKCIELEPTFLMGYVCKAKIQALMYNYESALATYIEGLKCDPNNLLVNEGLNRCVTCIKRTNGGDVGPEDLNDILRDWHSDIDLCNELIKSMEEVEVYKKEASDERLRRIESEEMVNSYRDILKNYHDKHFYLKKVILSRLEGHMLALSVVHALSRFNHSYYKLSRLLMLIQAILVKSSITDKYDLCNELIKSMEEVEVYKKEASDERLRRIESEEMARKLEVNQVQQQKENEEYVSKIQQELQQLKVRRDEFQKANQQVQRELLESKMRYMEELHKTNEHSKSVQHQLLESKERNNRLQSEHDQLLNERDRAVGEVEKLRQRRGEVLSVLRTAMPRHFSSSELECATENFSTSLKIGEGVYASVYRGVLRNMKVAIKVLRPDELQGRSQFEQEVAIHSRVRHPKMVTLLGACPESYTLVYEFLPNGSLEDFLLCTNKRKTLTWQIRVRIIAEICSALIFLHENKPDPVIHGDLKPANILLDVNLVSKLIDFGIPHLLNQSNSNSTEHPVETPIYMDPEFLATWKITTHSDVYSFGIIVLRLLTGKPPFGIKKIVEDAMEQGDLTSIVDTSAGDWPDVQIQQLAYLALSCTELSRESRPDLSGQLWTAIETMRDVAALSSPSSLSSVRDENHIPSYFLCPICQDVMKDPHLAADGFTYEGDCIRSWLGRGKKTSPMTNLRLQNLELIPNLALRSAIQDWLQQHNTLLQ
ncbi:unnamed protein product [Alopecurus aequalis]